MKDQTTKELRMTQTEPNSLGELWTMIQRDSRATRDALKRELDDVKRRLDTFVTKDHFEAEKRLLETRIQYAEQALEKLEREARDRARGRAHSRREFVYKGIIPALALLIAVMSIYLGAK